MIRWVKERDGDLFHILNKNLDNMSWDEFYLIGFKNMKLGFVKLDVESLQ